MNGIKLMWLGTFLLFLAFCVGVWGLKYHPVSTSLPLDTGPVMQWNVKLEQGYYYSLEDSELIAYPKDSFELRRGESLSGEIMKRWGIPQDDADEISDYLKGEANSVDSNDAVIARNKDIIDTLLTENQ